MAKSNGGKRSDNQDYDELDKRFHKFIESFRIDRPGVENKKPIEDNKLSATLICQPFRSQEDMDVFSELVENKLKDAGLHLIRAIRQGPVTEYGELRLESLDIVVELLSDSSDDTTTN